MIYGMVRSGIAVVNPEIMSGRLIPRYQKVTSIVKLGARGKQTAWIGQENNARMPSRTCRVPDVTQSAIQRCTLFEKVKTTDVGGEEDEKKCKSKWHRKVPDSCQPIISFFLLVHLPNWYTSFALFLFFHFCFHLLLFFSLHLSFFVSLFLPIVISIFVMPRVLRKKIVIIGDGACGKTSLLIVYQKGKFPEVNASWYLLLDNYMTAYLHNKT